MQVAEARPPYVTFELKAEEDRPASIEAGYYRTKDVAYALITPQGSKDRIERPVEEWLTSLRQNVQEQRFPIEWLRHYEEAYRRWKEGLEIPENGTPLLTWPVIPPSQVKLALEFGIRTVEDLANANEETIMRIGMGGRALKDKAISWLKNAAGPGKQAEEVASLRAQLTDQKLRNDTLEATVQSLMARLEKLEPQKK